MATPAIRVEGLGKRYRISGQGQKYVTLRDSIAQSFTAPFRRARAVFKGGAAVDDAGVEDFWALRDVSFDIQPGEVVGVVGRNGAGKSTFLKLLSRITEPTEGRAELQGRVGSLLEVGTGFHPELTGRENIYLNGAILGMRQAEIAREFDAIVAFAEIDKFLDTAVKHYSSGMYVRLAFAVAAHLQPEILLVDEVLAVGDFAFQRKCLGKMQDVAGTGRTVLFVSHNMQAVARLCTRAILLEKGRLILEGPTPQIVSAYLHSGQASTCEKSWKTKEDAPGDEVVKLWAIRASDDASKVPDVFDIRRPVTVSIDYEVFSPVTNLVCEIDVYNEEGVLIFASVDQSNQELIDNRPVGRYRSSAVIPGNLLSEGTFFIRLGILEMNKPLKRHVMERDAIVFQLVDPMEGDSARGRIAHQFPGLIRPKLEWRTERVSGPT